MAYPDSDPIIGPRGGEDVSPVFRIGHPSRTIERVVDGVRLLEWQPTGTEQLQTLAGWSAYYRGVSDGLARIEVPAGTRNASSVLSGKEAWEGEKASILRFIAQYSMRAAALTDGAVDTSVTLDTVAVTKNRNMFIAPPHELSTDRALVVQWRDKLVHDTEQVLSNDPGQAQLIEELTRETSPLVGE